MLILIIIYRITDSPTIPKKKKNTMALSTGNFYFQTSNKSSHLEMLPLHTQNPPTSLSIFKPESKKVTIFIPAIKQILYPSNL